jgi:hypothetical protein
MGVLVLVLQLGMFYVRGVGGVSWLGVLVYECVKDLIWEDS